MFNSTVTLYNAFYDVSTDEYTYYTYVIEKAEIQETRGANISSSGMLDSDSAVLYVKNDNNLTKTYYRPKEWNALSDKSNAFTFTPMSNDFFVKGNIVETDKDYEEMNRIYDDVYKVTTVDIYEDILPHFEVGGV